MINNKIYVIEVFHHHLLEVVDIIVHIHPMIPHVLLYLINHQRIIMTISNIQLHQVRVHHPIPRVALVHRWNLHTIIGNISLHCL